MKTKNKTKDQTPLTPVASAHLHGLSELKTARQHNTPLVGESEAKQLDGPRPSYVQPPPTAPVIVWTQTQVAEAARKAAKLPPTQPSLRELYDGITAAPPEWIPSLLARVIGSGMKAGVWGDTENLIASVKSIAAKGA